MTNDKVAPHPPYRIAWLPGDGIGTEVLEAARLVLDRLELDAIYLPGDIGWECWKNEGDPLPHRTIELLKTCDCALFGAITSKPSQEAAIELKPPLQNQGLSYRSPIVRLRREFNLHTCIRPCLAFPGNPQNFKEGIDLIVFRENTEDLYAGVEFGSVPKELNALLLRLSPAYAAFAQTPENDIALSLKINTRKSCERIIHAAFEYASRHKRRQVTAIHKANVVRAGDGLFLETAKGIAREYPSISLAEANIDALCMWLLKNPLEFDVLVAPNLYGDIVSDLCAQLVGGLGFAPSANIGNRMAVFEPSHGSAPKYAGKHVANPIAAILSARLMLEWLGEHERAKRLQHAVSRVIADGRVRTRDMGGSASTSNMARAISDAL